MNLPDINWTDVSIKGNHVSSAIKLKFLDNLQNCGLEQIVTFPTLLGHWMYRYSYQTDQVSSTDAPIPGLSDHYAVFVKTPAVANCGEPVKRKIYLWKKADENKMKSEIIEFKKQFLNKYVSSSPIEETWNSISTTLCMILESSVPSKMTNSRFKQPWINQEIKALSRRKKRQFKKAKSTKHSVTNQHLPVLYFFPTY